ncbi:MAG: C45 family autoproteolytic acyltransferase/hydrolase, partial [Armatimonadota bacterium]
EHSPPVYAEFMALADALEVGPDELLIGNGYTDYIDVLKGELAGEGCTSFIATGAATADGLTYVGQTWDMHQFAEKHMRVFRREPEDGPAWVTLTTSGCLSLIGLSARQIAVGNTNVVPRDARPGVMYLAMIHEALRSPDYASARAAIAWAQRASGHYYYVASISGSATGLETTATRHTALPMPEGLLVHANHYHDEELRELEVGEPSENSLAREALLDGYLRERAGELTLEDLMAGLRLDEGEHPVCRPPADDPDATTTCAAAIMCPQLRKMWVAPANPATAEFEEITV